MADGRKLPPVLKGVAHRHRQDDHDWILTTTAATVPVLSLRCHRADGSRGRCLPTTMCRARPIREGPRSNIGVKAWMTVGPYRVNV